MPKSDNLNILGSHDTQVSEPGLSWPSCLLFDVFVIVFLCVEEGWGRRQYCVPTVQKSCNHMFCMEEVYFGFGVEEANK